MIPNDVDLPALIEAHSRLADTLADVDEAWMTQPSALPGWTRAHVATHIARNADGIANLLLAARTGEVVYMYPSPAVREADITVGSTRAAALVVADVLTSAHRFEVAARHQPDHAWDGIVTMNPGPPARQVHAATLVWMRLREVEVHHGDFAADYTFAHTPAALATRLIDEAVNRLSPQMAASVELVTPNGTWRLGGADSPQIVHGSTGSSVAWLLGRSTGGLESASPLPTLPPWG